MRILSKFVMATIAGFLGCNAYAEVLSRFSITQGVTPISRDSDALHMVIFWICIVIGIVVFVGLIYSLIKYHKFKDAAPAMFHEHSVLEIVLAIIPFVILLVMVIPSVLPV